MESFDLAIIGAGAAGEAAAYLARERGASVAIVDRGLFGGSCAYWACMPSKTLLHAAAVHACGGDYPWSRAAARRDYMINREGPGDPDDAGHVEGLRQAGATPIRGEARIAGPGRLVVTTADGERELAPGAIIVAVGSNATVPRIEGLEGIRPWTNVEATSARELPRSLVIMGGGPTGVEMAQVYARYAVPVTIIHPRRLNDRDHPRNSAVLEEALRRDGVDVRTGVRATRIEAGAGLDGAHRIVLDDGAVVEGHHVLLAVGRTSPLAGLGLETVGVTLHEGRVRPDERLRLAPNVYVAGDPAGPELHTHLGHYQGEMAARIALGDDVRPDYSAIPHATYTDPETAGVGLRADQAAERGLDAFEDALDLATTAKGYVSEATGHAVIVVDRQARVLLGAFLAGPGASELVHEPTLAIKTRVPLAVLADTIHAFPTFGRVLGTLFMQAHRRLETGG